MGQRVKQNFQDKGLGNELVATLQAAGLPLPDPANARDVAQFSASFVAQMPNGFASWVDIGQGTAKDDGGEAAFRVLLWPAGAAVRRALELPPQDFHISLGFHNHDVHGKTKGLSSLITGAPSAASVSQLIMEATRLLEAVSGSDVDAEGVTQLAEAALLGATASMDVKGEAEALRVLCLAHGRMKRAQSIIPCAECLLELDPDDEAGTRSLAFALIMQGRFQDATPVLSHARAQLHKLPHDRREVEEGRLQQAEALCKKKLGACS